MKSTRSYVGRAILALPIGLALGILPPVDPPAAAQSSQDADQFLVVDCLLPGRVKKLGRKMTFMTPRRPVRTTQSDCEIRGGEYVAHDRANYATALKIWLPLAQKGDPKAQDYMGEMAEKGLGQTADYEMAVVWYRRAAEQGYAPAQINLGQLYEKGLGVPQDMQTAISWYRRASGLDSAGIQNVAFGDAAAEIQTLQSQLSERTQEVEALRAELASLNQELERVRSERKRVDSLATAQQAALEKERRTLAQQRKEVNAEKAALAELRKQSAKQQKSGEQAQGQRADVQALSGQLAQERAQLQRQAAALAAREGEIQRKQQELQKQQQAAESAESAEQAQRAKELAAARALLREQVANLAARETKLHQREQGLQKSQQVTERDLSAELEERARALAERERRMKERADQVAKRESELSALNKQIAELDSEIERRRAEVTSLRAGEGAAPPTARSDAPQIEMIEPQLMATRGVKVIYTRSDTKFRTIVGKAIAPRGLYQVLVNDDPLEVDENSLFQTRIPVGAEPTRVEIVAVDRTGQRGRLVFELRLEGKAERVEAAAQTEAVVPERLNVEFGKFYALLIGNRDYTRMPKLATPQQDVADLADVLKSKYSFETTVLLDAGRYEILSALNKMRATLTDKDNLLLYYAGHGELDEVNQRGHWLPVDAEPDSTANWISNVSVTDILNSMSVRKVMVVADSCYSGTLTRSTLARLDAGQSPEARLSWLRLMATKKSRTALTSGAVAPVLDGGGGRNSIFAKALIDALKQNDKVIDGRLLHQLVAQSVSYAADAAQFEQVPQYAPVQFAGHESGDFFFVPGRI
jgi:hypothetical protein